MLLTRDRILESTALGTADTGDVEAAINSVVFNVDGGADDASHGKCRAEDRPRQPTELAGEDLGQAAQLLVGHFRRNDEDCLAVPVVNCLRPIDDGHGVDSTEIDFAAIAFDYFIPHRGFATAVR